MRLLRRWPRADRFPLVDSKFGRILDLCEGKDVLDCERIGDEALGDAPQEHVRGWGATSLAR